jgi:hypothetical protein
MMRMPTKGWILAGSESENIAAAKHLGMVESEKSRLVEFINQINKNPKH